MNQRDSQGTKVSEIQPSPHEKYVVLRDGTFFTATPCYGMHAPWWVTRIMGAKYEADPVEMKDEDVWWPLEQFRGTLTRPEAAIYTPQDAEALCEIAVAAAEVPRVVWAGKEPTVEQLKELVERQERELSAKREGFVWHDVERVLPVLREHFDRFAGDDFSHQEAHEAYKRLAAIAAAPKEE